MTFDLALWPTDLDINKDHPLIKDYLPTKFEATRAKCSWVISCTRYSWLTLPFTLTFDLLTWKLIGIIYLSWTIYLLSLKLVGQSIVELSVTQGMTDQLDLWTTDLNTNRVHVLIKDYPPTKFEASGAKCSWVISCTSLRETDIPTDRHTDQRTCAMQYALLFQRGHLYDKTHSFCKFLAGDFYWAKRKRERYPEFKTILLIIYWKDWIICN